MDVLDSSLPDGIDAAWRMGLGDASAWTPRLQLQNNGIPFVGV